MLRTYPVNPSPSPPRGRRLNPGRQGVLSLCLLCAALVGSACAVEPWATYRGNPQRTGNTDGQAGPATPEPRSAMM